MVGTDPDFFFQGPSIHYLVAVMLFQFVFFTTLTLLLESIRFSLKDKYIIDESDR